MFVFSKKTLKRRRFSYLLLAVAYRNDRLRRNLERLQKTPFVLRVLLFLCLSRARVLVN